MIITTFLSSEKTAILYVVIFDKYKQLLLELFIMNLCAQSPFCKHHSLCKIIAVEGQAKLLITS